MLLTALLIEGRPRPTTAAPDEPLASAFDRMVEHDFSQLPVVDTDGHPLGVVSSDSILRALANFGVGVMQLRVKDALQRVGSVPLDEDFLEALDLLRDDAAVLVVDADQLLVGIVTSYDATEYFRGRMDSLLVEDIESTLRQLILTGFVAETEDGRTRLARAVGGLSTAGKELRRPFGQALDHYLKSTAGEAVRVDNRTAEEAFALYLMGQAAGRAFEDLNFGEYVQLFLHNDCWDLYKETFGVDRDAVRHMLELVRPIRNILAHSRRPITAKERTQLRFCRNWLHRHHVAPGARDAAFQEMPAAATRDRGPDYKVFFDAVLDGLRATGKWPTAPAASLGKNGLTVGRLPDAGRALAYLTLAFETDRRLRVELYIPGADSERNKQVFDALHARKVEIEAAVGGPVSWERFENRPGSRLALYRAGDIGATVGELAQLRAWAVDAVTSLRDAVRDHVRAQ